MPRGVRRGLIVASLVLGLGAGASACSDDGDLATFCSLLEEHRELLMGVDTDPQQLAEVLDVYDEVVDAAPGDIKGEARSLRDLLRKIRDADVTDADGFSRAIVGLADPGKIEDAEDFNAYVEQRCLVSLRTTEAPTTLPPAPG